jgi:hypothetical protein
VARVALLPPVTPWPPCPPLAIAAFLSFSPSFEGSPLFCGARRARRPGPGQPVPGETFGPPRGADGQGWPVAGRPADPGPCPGWAALLGWAALGWADVVADGHRLARSCGSGALGRALGRFGGGLGLRGSGRSYSRRRFAVSV